MTNDLSIVGTPLLLLKGVGPSKIWVTWGGGEVADFLLERGVGLEMRGLTGFLLFQQ